jgi:hypothetical protein
MPIKPENRHRYPKDWKRISSRIRNERAGNKCEQCGAPNGQLIARGTGVDAGTYMVETGEVYSDSDGTYLRTMKGSDYVVDRFVRIVLTVSHTNHDPSDCRDDNLRALCQRCHLAHDREHHQREAANTRRSRKACGELFQ